MEMVQLIDLPSRAELQRKPSALLPDVDVSESATAKPGKP
jgi:hypothetical protein